LKFVMEQRVAQLLNSDIRKVLQQRQVGLEKESLRVSANGGIAQTAHPARLGSALTHPSITTDYSEALLELVTPPFQHFSDSLDFLDDTHRYVYSQLDNEFLWASSMPCIIDGDASIPIAEYGSSNAGRMKTAYRRGLGHRYGRMMQAIAGVHFNYSYPESFWRVMQSVVGDKGDLQSFISESYIGMVRNLQRFGWLVPYLFGTSPAICASFIGGTPTSLQKWREHTFYAPYATSLRMGDIGYQNDKGGEASIKVDYNSLQGYVDSLQTAISTPYPEYAKIEMIRDGEWQQLNSNRLQIENEYYSSVRPKQILQGEEKPTLALARRGVAYIELRSLDVNAYEPLGISEEQMRFLESFLLFSVLTPSAPYDEPELASIKYNLNEVALRGRDPQLKLRRNDEEVLLRDWANEIFEQMSAGCDLLDKDTSVHYYCDALQQQRAKIADPELTPSARMIAEMDQNGEEFYQFALRMSRQHQQWFNGRPLDDAKRRQFERLARESITKQQTIEAANDVPFETFLQNYFKQS
jgi:glutamate--cysteine ligase